MTITSKKWKMPPKRKKEDILSLPDWFLNILFVRGLECEQNISTFLEPKYEDLVLPMSFQDMDRAVKVIQKKLESKEKIVIYGDYDVDGVTATTLLYDVLGKVSDDVSIYIPSREDEGYGINAEAIRKVKKEGAKLVISVDCGINSGDILDSEEFSEMDFVVCDHHEIDKDKIPTRAAVLHPSLREDKASLGLSGCGMAFFLAKGLMENMTEGFNPGEEKWLLDLVALATVCDVVPLVSQNRILAKYGLTVLKKTRREGLKALCTVASLASSDINSYALGFVLGPRLNAAGRLESAEKAQKLLSSKDVTEARNLAMDLNRLNEERQNLCNDILDQAKKEILENKLYEKEIIVLASGKWPKGVVGIIASRISDYYSRPVIIFENDGKECHGSARSIDSLDITEAIGSCAKLLIKFGGHAKAAGLTLKSENLEKFKEEILKVVRKSLKLADLTQEVKIDTKIKPEDINDAALELISKLEPVGFGNKTPIFMVEKVRLENIKKVGAEQNHLKFTLNKGLLSGIFFNNHLELKDEVEYDLVGNLRYNEWNNRKSIEFRVIDAREHEEIAKNKI